jgi:hypothetical protein
VVPLRGWAARREGRDMEPRDPDGYLNRIRREVPDLDDLVELYLTEALQSSTDVAISRRPSCLASPPSGPS